MAFFNVMVGMHPHTAHKSNGFYIFQQVFDHTNMPHNSHHSPEHKTIARLSLDNNILH